MTDEELPEIDLAHAEEIPITEGPGGTPPSAEAAADAAELGAAAIRERASRNGFVADHQAPPARHHPGGSPSDQIELELRGRLTELEHWHDFAAPTIGLLAIGMLLLGVSLWLLMRKPGTVAPA
jgi:hypothetical protein